MLQSLKQAWNRWVYGDEETVPPPRNLQADFRLLFGPLLVGTLTVRDGMVPPTINYRTPDPECDLDYTPNTPRAREVEVAISNSSGFGGHNATLAIRRYRE